jgi:hypothetical protein
MAFTNRSVRPTYSITSRPLLCTIHHLINFALVRAENASVVPAVLDKGHQSKRTLRRPC